MASYFLHVKTFSRGKGSSATKAAAYRSGERIRDERSGAVHDYTDRTDVAHAEIVLPVSRWLGEEQDNASLGIVSEEAFVAAARSACVRCGHDIEVVCIYCTSGVDTEIGDPIADFTVFDIWAMDGVLAKLIERWPCYRKGVGGDVEDAAEGSFANHCPHCGAMQADYLLHSEPGDVFFGLAMDTPGAVQFTALEGRVGMSGDYGFGV